MVPGSPAAANSAKEQPHLVSFSNTGKREELSALGD
jgi:hypothetical protein